MLTPDTLPDIQRALAEQGLDGWLLFDFHGLNPVVAALARLEGMTTRRVFVMVPREGTPVAITHAIEQAPWRHWPAEWRREIYSSWRTLEALLATHAGGRRVAMEYSPGDAVPYLDRVPAGVLEMVRAAGAEVVSSGELVTRFYAVWSEADLASHRRAADAIARIARDAVREAGRDVRAGRTVTEFDVQRRILDAFARASLETTHAPLVGVNGNAANPHYEPAAETAEPIRAGDVLLVDLWARERGGAFADQTWMATVGPAPDRARAVWDAVRDARDAAITLLRERLAHGEPVRGADLDDAARAVIASRGLGAHFTHRTGHSIDPRDLHGSGPHLDNLESREQRLLVPGVAFSIEPGVYVPGQLGVRSEVNAYVGHGEAIITPHDYQRELIEV